MLCHMPFNHLKHIFLQHNFMLVYYFRYTDEIYLVLIQTTKVGLYNECNDILKMTFSENYRYKRIYKEMKKVQYIMNVDGRLW